MSTTTTRPLEGITVAQAVTVLGQPNEGRDSETYKVELKEMGGRTVTGYIKLTDSPHQLVAELAAAQLGRALDLPIPQPYLAVIDTELLAERFQSAHAGQGRILGFASRQAGNESYSLERLFQCDDDRMLGFLQAMGQSFDLYGATAFDELTANTDRNAGNILYTPATNSAWLIDHGRALTGEQWPLWGLADPGVQVTNLLADKNRDVWDEHQRRQAVERAHALCRRCAEVALEELDKDGHYPRIDGSINAAEVVEFLRQRIHHTVELLCRRLNIGHLSLSPPRDF